MKFYKPHIQSQEEPSSQVDQNICPNLPVPLMEKQSLAPLQQEEVYRTDIENRVFSSKSNLQYPHNYFHKQRDITEHMRGVLLNWLLQVHQKYRLMNETFFLTVRIIDAFLSQQEISRNRLQLVGIAALWIASKYQQTYHVPKMNDLERLSDYTFKALDILQMEGRILEITGFQLLLAPSPLHHLELLQNHARLPPKDYSLACYLLEASTFDLRLQRFSSNSLAFAVIYFIKKLKGYSLHGQESMRMLCQTNQHQLRMISRQLCALWQKAEHQSCLATLKIKYAQKQHFQVSKIRLTQRTK